VYLHKEHSCQISSQSDLKVWSFRLFEDFHPNKKNKNKMNRDMGSVPDPKIESKKLRSKKEI